MASTAFSVATEMQAVAVSCRHASSPVVPEITDRTGAISEAARHTAMACFGCQSSAERKPSVEACKKKKTTKSAIQCLVLLSLQHAC